MVRDNSTYIFRNPYIKIRREKFGGIAQAKGKPYMLGNVEFEALFKFESYMPGKDAEKKLGIDLLKSFLTVGFLLEINQEDAKRTIKERR